MRFSHFKIVEVLCSKPHSSPLNIRLSEHSSFNFVDVYRQLNFKLLCRKCVNFFSNLLLVAWNPAWEAHFFSNYLVLFNVICPYFFCFSLLRLLSNHIYSYLLSIGLSSNCTLACGDDGQFRTAYLLIKNLIMRCFSSYLLCQESRKYWHFTPKPHSHLLRF